MGKLFYMKKKLYIYFINKKKNEFHKFGKKIPQK